MLTLVAFVLSVIGFAALAVAMNPHGAHGQQNARGRGAVIAWRVVGAVSLGASLACAVLEAGAATGTILWVGMSSPGALVAVAVLSWRSRRRGRRSADG